MYQSDFKRFYNFVVIVFIQSVISLMKNKKQLKEGVAMVCTIFHTGLHMILFI